MIPKVNYLNNKDMLAEIHRSKNTYCSYTSPEYHQYDLILPSIDHINMRTTATAKRNQAKRLGDQEFARQRAAGNKIRQIDCEINYKKICKQAVVFRIMTFDHIPTNLLRKKNPKTIADRHEKVNFPPFQHWKYNDENELICVGKSHWKGDLDTGNFDKNHGQITSTLAQMMLKLCERYATRGNVRLYTYNDEMKCQAILQLTQIGLQFDESKSDNPFAYFTAAVANSFVRIINIEKRNQNIRDDILEMNGLNPSYTRTIDNEYECELRRHNRNNE